tara:strand:+ start:2231 stop:3115 length:885 start_codon:yes stop_codon:yes gene_type:complete
MPNDNNYFSLDMDEELDTESEIKKMKEYSRVSKNYLLFFQTIYTLTYLATETLQLSNSINKHDHIKITYYSYVYNLTLILFVCYAINNISSIGLNIVLNDVNLKNHDIVLYVFFCVGGGTTFAMLGEIQTLKKIVINGDFLKNLSLISIITITAILIPIIIILCNEIYLSWKEKKLRRELFNSIIVTSSFTLSYFILLANGAEEVHLHVHHAIFAGTLAMFCSNWKKKYVMFLHAVLMGVVIEGIGFYGISEFYIFMCKNTVIDTLNNSLIFVSIYTWCWFIIFFTTYRKIFGN